MPKVFVTPKTIRLAVGRFPGQVSNAASSLPHNCGESGQGIAAPSSGFWLGEKRE